MSVIARLFVLCVSTLWAGQGLAGVSITYSTESPDGSLIERVTFHVQDGQLRFASQGGIVGASGNDFYLYHHGTRRLRYVQPNLAIYHELSPGMLQAALADLNEQREQLRNMLDTQLADAPPAQRRAVEQALTMVDAALSQVDSVFEGDRFGQVSLGDRIGSLTLDDKACEVYLANLFNAEIEVCFAAAGELGLSGEEVAIMQSFQQLLAEISGVANLYSLLPGHLPLAASYGQLGGAGTMTTLLKGIERRQIPRSMMSIPQHFRSSTEM